MAPGAICPVAQVGALKHGSVGFHDAPKAATLRDIRKFCNQTCRSPNSTSNLNAKCTRRSRRPSVFRVQSATAIESAPSQITGPDSQKKVRPSAAELARTVLELGAEGTICCRHGAGGMPLGTYAAYILDAEGRPVLLLRNGGLAAAGLGANSECSFHVQVELPGLQKPQVTITGKAAQPADAATVATLEAAWKRAYGEDFSAEATHAGLWPLELDQILVCRDADDDGVWITGEEYLCADPDPLRESARKIVEDVNREHWQDLPRFCITYADIEEEVDDASMIWVDRLGLDLRVWLRAKGGSLSPTVRDVRIPFAREALDEREARSAITMMAQVSWEKERNYTPVVPSAIPIALGEEQSS